MAERIKLAVIGAGGIANNVHLPSLAEMTDICEVVAIADLVEEKARRLRHSTTFRVHTAGITICLQTKRLTVSSVLYSAT